MILKIVLACIYIYIKTCAYELYVMKTINSIWLKSILQTFPKPSDTCMALPFRDCYRVFDSEF